MSGRLTGLKFVDVIGLHTVKFKKFSDCQSPEKWNILANLDRAPVAQLVEHRAVTREVMSSTPAGPTLRVFK